MMRINYDDPQTMRKLERMAYDGSLDISDCPPAEYKYFDKIAIIGRLHRYEHLPKDICRERKEEAYKEYINAVAERNCHFAVMVEYQKNIMKTDELRCKITKATTIKEKLALAFKCIELMIGDNSSPHRELKYIKEDEI